MMDAPLSHENQTSSQSSSSSVIVGKQTVVVGGDASEHVIKSQSEISASSSPSLVNILPTSSYTSLKMVEITPIITTSVKGATLAESMSPRMSELVTPVSFSSQIASNIDPSKSVMVTDISSSITVPNVVPDSSSHSLCKKYRTIASDGSLSLEKALSTLTCDLRYESAVRFISTNGDSLQLKEGCELVDQQTRTCSGFNTNVWLNGSHPKVPGTTAMEVCIKSSDRVEFIYDYCRCERKDIFFVELCTTEDIDGTKDAFYVYRLFPLFKSKGNSKDAKDCNFKYCTEIQPGMLQFFIANYFCCFLLLLILM